MTQQAAVQWIKHLSQKGRVLVFGGSHHSELLVASEFERLPYKEVRDLKLGGKLPDQIVGFLSYDDMVAQEFENSFFYRVCEGILFDFRAGQHLYIGTGDRKPSLALISSQTDLLPTALGEELRIGLEPLQSDESYLEACQKALDWIRNGRFYQLNLLRYFKILGTSRAQFVGHWLRNTGDHGALLIDDDREIFSYSPEQFVISTGSSGLRRVETYPIKGTRRRSPDPAMDLRLKADLETSTKDRAELSMIIDLMRNDLARISKRNTVRVDSPGRVYSYPTVHHLVAQVSGAALDDLTLNQLFSILPAGSITGAPKVEVMAAISELESRRRGFFMGSAFHLNSLGDFKSTVMIRTALKVGDEYQYAAGSGIVVKSIPEDEMAEIYVKCRVLSGDQDDSNFHYFK
ncbi:MAG: chorismate-binding protein [Pseudomonadota bacterium]